MRSGIAPSDRCRTTSEIVAEADGEIERRRCRNAECHPYGALILGEPRALGQVREPAAIAVQEAHAARRAAE
jgi:hypothetical protein